MSGCTVTSKRTRRSASTCLHFLELAPPATRSPGCVRSRHCGSRWMSCSPTTALAPPHSFQTTLMQDSRPNLRSQNLTSNHPKSFLPVPAKFYQSKTNSQALKLCLYQNSATDPVSELSAVRKGDNVQHWTVILTLEGQNNRDHLTFGLTPPPLPLRLITKNSFLTKDQSSKSLFFYSDLVSYRQL